MFRKIFLSLALIIPSSAAFGQGATQVAEVEVYAPSTSEFPSMAVGYSDLNLNNEAGAQALVDRLRFASTVVCDGAGTEWKGPNRWLDFKKCADTAFRGAVTKLDNPLVTAQANLPPPGQ